MTMTETTISTSRIFKGKVVGLRIDTVRLPDGKTAVREIVEHPGAVAIVPVTDDGAVILVRQYRHATGQVMLEIPAGKLDPGESPEACARRELAEETGQAAGVVRHLASLYTTPGFTNELIHLFAAYDLTTAEAQADPDEFIDVVRVTPDELTALIAGGGLKDMKTLAGLAAAGYFHAVR